MQGRDRLGFRPYSNCVNSLDGIRALSIALVWIQHVISDKFPGGYGVWVFFVVSGYLIARIMFIEWGRAKSINVRNFYIRRIIRLYPVLIFYLAIVTFVFLFYAKVDCGEVLSVLFYYANYELSYKEHFVMPLAQFWSLSLEGHFYFLFPIVFIGCRGRAGLLLIVSIISILGALLIRTYGVINHAEMINKHWFYVRTEYRFDSIAFGVLLAAILEMDSGQLFMKIFSGNLMFGIFAIILILFISIRVPFYKATWAYTGIEFSIMILIYNVMNMPRDSFISNILNSSLLIWFGRISYSIYVWHLGVNRVVEFAIGGENYVIKIIISLLAAIIISTLSYFLIERKFTNLKSRLIAM